MSNPDIIVVGADGSNESIEAVNWAIARAQLGKMRLHVVCAYALPSFKAASVDGGFIALDDEAVKKAAQAIVDEVIDHVKQRAPELEVSGQIEAGDPSGVLIDLSKEATIMAVGTRGGGGFADRLLGTVSSALPAHAHCPVVVVPRFKEGTPFTPIKRVVVGVDGGNTAGRSLHYALAEAKLWDAKVTAVEAVPIASTAGVLAWLPASVDRDAMVHEIRERLDEVVSAACEEIPGVIVKAHALDGNAAALLAEFSSNVDLLVVGTRGRGGFAGLLLGSTSQAVLSHSLCPVMVVPTRADVEDIPAELPWQRG